MFCWVEEIAQRAEAYALHVGNQGSLDHCRVAPQSSVGSSPSITAPLPPPQKKKRSKPLFLMELKSHLLADTLWIKLHCEKIVKEWKEFAVRLVLGSEESRHAFMGPLFIGLSECQVQFLIQKIKQ